MCLWLAHEIERIRQSLERRCHIGKIPCKSWWWHIWELTVVLIINCLFSFYMHTVFVSIIFHFLPISCFNLSLSIFSTFCFYFPPALFLFELTLVFCGYFNFPYTLSHEFRNALYMKFLELLKCYDSFCKWIKSNYL